MLPTRQKIKAVKIEDTGSNIVQLTRGTWLVDGKEYVVERYQGIEVVVNDPTTVQYKREETFKDYWLGLYLNTYENKVAFCDIVNKVYFPSITPNVLSPDFNNYVKVDWEAHKAYVVLDGGNPDTMTEAQLKQYPTNGDVILTGEVRFTNSMISLELKVLF